MVAGGYSDTQVSRNVVTDDQDTPTLQYGIYLLPTAAGSGNELRGNAVRGAYGHELRADGSLGVWLAEMDVDAFSEPIGLLAVGSELRDVGTGVAYRQTEAPEGSTWKGYIPGTVRAQDLSFPVPGVLTLPGVSGNYLSTPDAAEYDVAGALRIRVDVALDDWTAAQYLAARWSSGGKTWVLYIEAGGRAVVAVLTGAQTAKSGVIAASPGDRIMIEVTVDPADGTAVFRRSDDAGESFTSLGSGTNTIGGAFAWGASSLPVSVGGYAGASGLWLAGQVYSFDLYDVGGAATLAHLDLAEPAAVMVDEQDHAWTINGSDWSIAPQFVGSINGQSGAVSLPSDGAAEVASLRTLGTGATQACAGDDARLAAEVFSQPLKSGDDLQLAGRPVSLVVGTGSHAKDTWRYMPIRLKTAITLSSIGVNTTIAASGGTAAMRFGLFAADADLKPAGRTLDISATHGTLDLTPVAGLQRLTTVGLVLPAGEYFIGCAWAGTASTPPTMSTLSGIHPMVTHSTFSATSSAYSESASGASTPTAAGATAIALPATMLVGRIA